MNRPLPLLLSAVITLLAVNVATAQVPDAPRAEHFPSNDSLTARLALLVESGRAKGLALGVLEPDGARRIVSYGTAGPDASPLGPRSVFEIGSVVKTFTATLLADMVARGEVALTDPVSRYLPAAVGVPSRGGREITLLDLATHFSGLPRLPDNHTPADPDNPYADYTVEKLYEFLGSHELRRDVGSEFEYSNLGFGLLGHALARAAGGTYEGVVRERILDPLCMRQTAGAEPRGDMAAWMTQGHRGDEVAPHWDVPEALAGAGGLRSSIEDMLTYLDANVRPARTLLERAMHEAQVRRRDANERQGVGLAWLHQTRGDRRIVFHTGDTGGYQTIIAFDPDTGAGVVLLSNSSNAQDGQLFKLAFDLVVPPPPGVAVAEATLQTYVGEYEMAPGRSATVTLEDGDLFIEPPGGAKTALFARSETAFAVGSAYSRTVVAFTTDDSGAVVGLALQMNGVERPGRRVR